MLFVLFNKEKVIGCFDNKDKLDIMMSGLKNNNLCRNLRFECFHSNSICSTEYVETIVSSDENSEDKSINKSDNKNVELSEKDIEKQKKIEYNLKVLKQRKERIEESKRTFKVDLDLYNKFKSFREKDNQFEIPPLFIDKWTLMSSLDNNNNLDWEHFHEQYTNRVKSNEYSKFFNGDANAKDRELVDVDTEPETTDNEDN